ncbi:membrane protein [Gordonia phage Squiddly]|nr:membrane protein [Gordonia phage Squiddly]
MMRATVKRAAITVPVYLLLVLWVNAVWPPTDDGAFVAYVIIAVLGLMTVVAFCLPAPPQDRDDFDVVGRALQALPPDGGEQ